MPRRRLGVWVFGALGVGSLVVATLAWTMIPGDGTAESTSTKDKAAHIQQAPAKPPIAERSERSLPDLAQGIRQGDGKALAALVQRLTPAQTENEPAPAPSPLTAAEAGEWYGMLDALAAGYTSYSSQGKASAQDATYRIATKFAVEPTPPGWWIKALKPIHDVLSAGLSDPSAEVRAVALERVGSLWVWTPGCTMTPAEEQTLGLWKQAFHEPVVQRLSDTESLPRAAAVACLAALPIDSAAAPAVGLIADPDPGVRLQVLSAFSNRENLLSPDDILPMLHDPVPDLAGLAERVLKARGLSQELVGLGRLITHPQPDLRASAIPLLLKRDDIDPVIWLLHLADDADESVRLAAVRAFAGRITPEVKRRLQQMATNDASSSVREAAGKLVPAIAEQTTVVLPPCPAQT